MCHLACWIINQDPKEGHGKAWKSWWVTSPLSGPGDPWASLHGAEGVEEMIIMIFAAVTRIFH
jgi:hypothetical protein